MAKKSRIFLAIPVLILGFACKPKPEQTATDTVSTTVTTATGGSGPTDTIAPPPGHEIDHYKLWKVRPVEYARDVKLKGQFDQEAWPASVRSIEYLGNPVEKNGEPILKPEWHLVAYRIKAPPQPLRGVVIENQFRKGEMLRISEAAWLLLPASKVIEGQPPEPPRDADHYVCYVVAPADPVIKPVTLMDQFDRKRDKREEIKQLSAVYFCVPVSKDGSQIYKAKEHLTIYKLDPPTPYAITASTWDQFGPRRLAVVQSELLAVPTFKVDWKKLQ